MASKRPSNVIHVPFSEAQKAQASLEDLAQLPTPPGRAGVHALHSNGERVSLLVSTDTSWTVIETFSHDKVSWYLHERRAKRQGILGRIKRARCRHDYTRSGRCKLCQAVREKLWTRCGMPRRGSYEDFLAGRAGAVYTPSGEVHYNIHRTRCRRRSGHDGPCSWALDAETSATTPCTPTRSG
jgi:hypothetical protein